MRTAAATSKVDAVLARARHRGAGIHSINFGWRLQCVPVAPAHNVFPKRCVFKDMNDFHVLRMEGSPFMLVSIVCTLLCRVNNSIRKFNLSLLNYVTTKSVPELSDHLLLHFLYFLGFARIGIAICLAVVQMSGDTVQSCVISSDFGVFLEQVEQSLE